MVQSVRSGQELAFNARKMPAHMSIPAETREVQQHSPGGALRQFYFYIAICIGFHLV
jgi:hypothetical protein